jgi:hypothetical protein
MKLITAIFLLFAGLVSAQPLNVKNDQGGLFSLGGRTTISTFNHGEFGNTGLGIGGQFRLQFADQVNSDWFFDYIQGKVDDVAFRTDYHIGWSVLFYPTKKFDVPVRPYILAGHCFDYTRVVDNADRNNFMERWSSAVQGGAGVHVNLSQRLDLSVVGQYMVHLGTDVHADVINGQVQFRQEKGASLEGHLLFHVGINYKIADLW